MALAHAEVPDGQPEKDQEGGRRPQRGNAEPLLLWLGEAESSSGEELIRFGGEQLIAAGVAETGFVEELLAREAAYPTGVALRGGGVALPHADSVHVVRPAIAMARATRPVPFLAMDGSSETVMARIAIFLAITAKDRHLAWLSRVAQRLSEPGWLERAERCGSDEEFRQLVTG